MEDEFLFHRRNDYDSTWKVFDSSKISLTIVLRVLYERFIIVGRKAKKTGFLLVQVDAQTRFREEISGREVLVARNFLENVECCSDPSP